MAHNLPEKDLVRYEFLEALVRLAHVRFVVTKENEYMEDAVERLMKMLHRKFDVKVNAWQ